LIGGQGKDNLGGGEDDDILIGGTTVFEADLTELAFLLTLSLSDAATEFKKFGGVSNETDSNNAPAPLTDTMDGNSGADLYFADLDGIGKDTIKKTIDDSVEPL
jgi:hypothetical protein